jgi:hypothetical protein
MAHRTVRDIELELQRVKSELQHIVEEDGDADSYCVELADGDPVLYTWLITEFFPEESLETMLDIVRDHPELLVTYH